MTGELNQSNFQKSDGHPRRGIAGTNRVAAVSAKLAVRTIHRSVESSSQAMLSLPYAWTGSRYLVPSTVAKSRRIGETESLAVEWGPKKIRTVAISPGTFPTPAAWHRLIPPAMEGAAENSNSAGPRRMTSAPIFVPISFPSRPPTSTAHASLLMAAGCRARGCSRLAPERSGTAGDADAAD
jgi:NAD(P)-dependent dehydrogenase (short-subunit alcohol dehydrogenase family)